MLGGERGEAIVDFVPHFVGGDGAKLAGGNFNGEIELTTMADLHCHGIRPVGAGEKVGYELDGLLCGRKANARQAPAGQVIETFE